MGRYAEAEPLYRRSLAIGEKQLGPTTPTWPRLHNLAAPVLVHGPVRRGRAALRRSLAIREKQLGADHPHVAQSLNNLAALYQAMGRYAEAEPLFRRSLAIREKQLGATTPTWPPA